MGKSIRLITAEDSICRLNAFDAEEQELKDLIHERLNKRCEFDENTGCWVFTGCWSPDGQALIRIGQNKYKVVRAAAWVYIAGFHLEDKRFPFRRCSTPACFNPAHILVAETRSEMQGQLRLLGRWGQGRRKLNQKIADGLRLAYANMPPGCERVEFVRLQAKSLAVTPQSIRNIIDDISWVKRDAEQPSG